MALLTLDERKAIFKELGLGEYNKENIKALQKKYMYRKSDWDGVYGQNTDNLLRTVYYTKVYTKNFSPKEFRCSCNGRYCCGFPTYMKPAELIHIQKIRDHYGKPITITCGMRDKKYNASLGGSIQNSLHLQGQALDFYQSGVTDTLANRKKSIKWIKKQANHHYTYGNGINSNGYSVRAPYMGNALHTDTYDNVAPKHPTLKNDADKTNTQEPQKKPSESVQKPSATTSAPSKYKVIDVSVWQGYIDWKKVKADGVVGAIIRYADGASIDTRFEENMKNAKAAGLHVGSYIFSRAKNKKQAQREAERIFNACKPYALDMPIYIDLEAKGLEKYADTVAIAFLNKIKSLGGKGGVYANLNWWNNYLTKTAKDYSSNAFWIAQYYDKITHKNPKLFGMWQYSSSGKVEGINGKVDMDWCYKAYWDNAPKPEPEPPKPTKKGYSGTFPTTKLVKSNAQVIADAIRWAKWIAGDNSFHYGYTNKHGSKDPKKWNPNAHHNGCYFCGTNVDHGARSKKGIVDYKKTYCCNPFVGAAWAHGGCVPKALEMCRKGTSWDYHEGKGYDKSSLFDKLKKPKKADLKLGYVLCRDTHVALYIGDGKIVHASGGDDNKKGSDRWNKSIRVQTLTDANYAKFKRVYRFNGKVDADFPIYHGEVSERVKHLQEFLEWYFDGKAGTPDGIYGDTTYKWVKEFQKKELGSADGIVGANTIEAMKKVKK